uniref:Uncharacterized protein n=1 Tax=Phocoena sinus TaxID=42100 RepID=A0A8C9BYI9_PHOSS
PAQSTILHHSHLCCRISFTIPWHLAQDGTHVVVSIWKQQNVDWVVAVLQGERLNMTGTVCHVGKAEKRDWLLSMLRDPGREREVPAVLLSQVLPLVEKRGEGREGPWSWGDSALLSSTPRGHLGKDVSKMALLGLSQTLAVELASKNIWVNFLVPGIINTDCSQTLMGRCHHSQPHLLFLCRVEWPEDCAELVSFLCSSDASYITGKNIMVPNFSPTSEGYELRAQACLLM